MSEEELIKALKEFDEKRVEQLNDNARNLFNAIMDIANQRDKLLEEKQELIDYLKEEQYRLAIETSAVYEDSLGKIKFVNEDVYNEVGNVLSKIEKEKI